jgi:menaquinol-cytochrome c reductase iron-sulfur subunit
MTKTPNISRNDFVKGVVGLLGGIMGVVVGIPAIGFVLAPALKKSSAQAWIPLGPLTNYTVGTPTQFNFTRSIVNGWEKSTNSYGVFVYRKSDSETVVLSNVCTHLSCRVNWNDAIKEYVCPCHDAHFDSNGKVVSGPPPRPLDGYESKVENGNLFIHFVKG